MIFLLLNQYFDPVSLERKFAEIATIWVNDVSIPQ